MEREEVSEMRQMVCGFAFDGTGIDVALILKNRPKWQAGKLNGIGGHIENGELGVNAMVREFQEETGLKTQPEDWRKLFRLDGDSGEDWFVYFFAAYGIDLNKLKTRTDEQVVVCKWKSVAERGWVVGLDCPKGYAECIPNLRWILPMAAQRHIRGGHLTDLGGITE